MKAQDEEQLRDLLMSLSNLQKIEVIQFDHYGVQLNRNVLLDPPGFALSPNLRFLEFRGLEFSKLPAWINPGRLPKLCHLWLMVFDVDDQDLKILGSFPGLVCLHLLIVKTERGDVTTCCSGAFLNLKFCSITKPLQFVYGAMPRLEILDFHFNVRLLRDFNHSFDFNFGLENLGSLQKLIVQINCLSASPEEVGKAEAAVRHAVHIHTNFPTLKISLFGQRMELDADLTRNLEKVST
jgi:disease resistance protein RPM1